MQENVQPEGNGNGQQHAQPTQAPAVTVGIMPNGQIGVQATVNDREMILRLLATGLNAVLAQSAPKAPPGPKIILPGIEINGKRF